MNSKIDLRVLELVCSRLCHDLISPITAVNNGMELLADSPPDILDEIKELLTSSAGEASRRLQFYRIAYGLGGQESAPVGMEEAGRLARGLLERGKIELAWPDGSAGSDLGKPGMKLLLNTLLLGLEALPRGGHVAVSVTTGGAARIEVVSEGQGARITDESRAAMAPDADVNALTARSVQAYLTATLAGAQGGRLELDASQTDRIVITTSVGASA